MTNAGTPAGGTPAPKGGMPTWLIIVLVVLLVVFLGCCGGIGTCFYFARNVRTTAVTALHDLAEQSARNAHARVDIATLQVAVESFELDTGAYPSEQDGLNALVVQPAGVNGWKGPYIKDLPTDPWGHPYRYKCPGTHKTDFDIWSAGADGRDNTDDDVVSWNTK